jgi:triosephosphate isomerase (TIM)
MIIGVSLKMYFGHAQTLDWCRTVGAMAAERPPSSTRLFLLPSFPSLPGVADVLSGSGVAFGAQDLTAEDAGAQTGEVGGAILAELGCRYVEVGHAERRTLFGESEELVSAKTAAALRHGLVPVLCLGEAGHGEAAPAAVECVRQLDSALAASRTAGLTGPLVVAYEPHWAIGAAEPAPEEHISTVCAALRVAVAKLDAHPESSVIYGGSAGPGLLTRLADTVDGLFLGRFAHEPAALATVLDEADRLTDQRLEVPR